MQSAARVMAYTEGQQTRVRNYLCYNRRVKCVAILLFITDRIIAREVMQSPSSVRLSVSPSVCLRYIFGTE